MSTLTPPKGTFHSFFSTKLYIHHIGVKMSGSGYLYSSYDPFEKMVIFPPNPLAVGSNLMVQQHIFKSKVVAYVKPSSSCNVVLILRIGYGLCTIRLLSSLKSDIVRTVWSFLGIMKEGEAHLDVGCHFSTPITIRQSISFMRVALFTFGIGYDLPWYSLASSFSSMETGGNLQSPSMPSKSSSYLRSNTRSEFQCGMRRCTQSFLTMLGRSALSYLASKISTTCLVALRVLSGSWAQLELSLSALEMLYLSCRLLMFLVGKRMSSMVMVISLKSNTVPISCKICLPMIRLYNGFGSPSGYSTISGCRCTFLLAEQLMKEISIHPPFWF